MEAIISAVGLIGAAIAWLALRLEQRSRRTRLGTYLEWRSQLTEPSDSQQRAELKRVIDRLVIQVAENDLPKDRLRWICIRMSKWLLIVGAALVGPTGLLFSASYLYRFNQRAVENYEESLGNPDAVTGPVLLSAWATLALTAGVVILVFGIALRLMFRESPPSSSGGPSGSAGP
ncbi:hypothetical protein [Kineococcus sp. SYSU DK002]|uniref:hypothetical protein n=1 Tax=Kineococcus sp. SYSU DK002 TaxID=3383123 RepID=UPI003D7C774D